VTEAWALCDAEVTVGAGVCRGSIDAKVASKIAKHATSALNRRNIVENQRIKPDMIILFGQLSSIMTPAWLFVKCSARDWLAESTQVAQ
jgi:hypothetical protein